MNISHALQLVFAKHSHKPDIYSFVCKIVIWQFSD